MRSKASGIGRVRHHFNTIRRHPVRAQCLGDMFGGDEDEVGQLQIPEPTFVQPVQLLSVERRITEI